MALNIAGPRESEANGICESTRHILESAFSKLQQLE
jgi:hypothetical protein